MAVLLKGTTFSSGQSVDHTDMNNIIDTATLNPSESTGIIGSQTAEASIAGDDFVLIQDVSGSDILRKATVANLIGGLGVIQTSDNTAVGSEALDSLTSGVNNTAVGRQSLTAATTSSNNVAVGHQSAYNTTSAADDNVFIGYQAAFSNGNGDDSVIIGSGAGKGSAHFDKCVAIGKGAMQETGVLMSQNVAIGWEALKNAESGSGDEGNNNVAVGTSALATNTTGSASTAVGWGALALATTSSNNVAVGHQSAGNTTSAADDNVFIGYQAAFSNGSGDDSVIIGSGAGKGSAHFDKCVAIGKGAMQETGVLMSQNVAIGWEALKNAESGSGDEGNNNVAVGTSALVTNTTGSASTAVGYGALTSQTTPGVNSAFGYLAGTALTTATDNTLVGYHAGASNLTGDDNTFIGDFAGFYVTAAQNTALGSGANTASGAPALLSNTTCLGYAVNPTAANQVRLGNASVSSLHCQVGLTVDSDTRVKKDVKSSGLGLSFLNALRAVSFKKLNPFDWPEKLKEARFLRDESDKPSDPKPDDNPNVYTGFIAQEVKAVLDAQNITEWDGWSEGENGMQSLTMTAFVPALIKAVQELSAKVETLESK